MLEYCVGLLLLQVTGAGPEMHRAEMAPEKEDVFPESSQASAPVGNFVSGLRSMETAHRPITMLRSKVVIVGDATVGKTALTQVFHSGGQQYPKNYVMTIGVEFVAKQVSIPGTNTSVELYLYDCAGQSIFNQLNLNSKHWENASYVVVVYDVANRESFQSCARWLQGVRAQRPTSGGPLAGVLVANKSDLRQQDRGLVRQEEGEDFARINGLTYFEISAAANTGVREPFMFIANHFYQRYEETVRLASQVTQNRRFS